ncbi:hypothetical protein KR222_009440, partial [Zaprionus bogoriensis]
NKMQTPLLLLILSCAAQAAHSNNCNQLLRELATEQGHFIYCSTSHAVPVPPRDERLCVSCKMQNDAMAAKYEELMGNCSKEYNDADRMNIVLTTQGMLKGLWNKAYCDNCFINDEANLQNFTNLELRLKSCLQEHRGSECASCVLQYVDMNTFYKQLEQTSNGQICFDMQDMVVAGAALATQPDSRSNYNLFCLIQMNRTRVHWSTELKCCQREVKMTLFLICVAIVAVLPMVCFYGGAIVLTKRREARHGLLNDQEPALDAAPSTSQLITAAVLATPAERTALADAKTDKIAQVLKPRDSSDSSDDELPPQKPK